MSTAVHGRNAPSSMKRGGTRLCAYICESNRRKRGKRDELREDHDAHGWRSYRDRVAHNERSVLGRFDAFSRRLARNRSICRGGVEKDCRSTCRRRGGRVVSGVFVFEAAGGPVPTGHGVISRVLKPRRLSLSRAHAWRSPHLFSPA